MEERTVAKTELMSYRITKRRRQWIDELAEMLELDPEERGDGASVLDFALKFTLFETRRMNDLAQRIKASDGQAED